MSVRRLRLRHFGIGASKDDRIVEVEYREIPHYYQGANAAGRPWKRYEVVADGKVVGTIEQVTESTDRKSGRIRIPGKGRVAWAWTVGTRHNAPGCYRRTRDDAVADMLGFTLAEKVA